MARSKRLVTHPEEPSRAAVRRRTAEQPPSTTVGRDLNEPPPISGENPTTPVTAEEESSKQTSPKPVPSPHTSTSVAAHLDDEAFNADEEDRRLEEEYLRKKELIRKRKEEAEKRRQEEAERKRKEEEERRMEEARVKAERARLFDEERQKAEAEVFAQEIELQREVEQNYQEAYGTHQFVKEKEAVADPSPKPVEKRKRVVTRSTVTTKRTPTPKKPRKAVSKKGTTSTPSLESSSMEVDVGTAQVQTQHPHHSTVGTSHAPSGLPRQFTTPQVAAHFAHISSQKLKLERGFDPDFIDANAFIRDRLEAHDWAILAAPNRRANASLVREFYAEASQAQNPTVTVRGKKVCYSPREINRVLGRRETSVCEYSRFLSRMTTASEDLILREIAVEGRPWNKDGNRRCLQASSLTTEAAIWFQFVRASLAPTSHDTTLSMHKCALLYCLLTGKKINVGMVMHGAINVARTRKKVNLPLPCLITMLMVDAGVPTAVEDQWFDSTSNINVSTIRRMGRRVTTPSPEPEDDTPTVGTVHPTVRIAEEHMPGPSQPPPHSTDAGTPTNTMKEVVEALKQITYRLELLEAQQRFQDRATNTFWMYTKERDEVLNQIFKEAHPTLAAQLPDFPEDICMLYDSEAEATEDDAESSPSVTPHC